MLRDEGYTVGITEHFNPWVRIRQDFCGFADCIAFKPGVPTLAVNAMHLKDRTHHKFESNEKLSLWVASGNAFEMHQWHCVGERGKRKLWEVERVPLTFEGS